MGRVLSANKSAVLLLEDGRVFTGNPFGHIGQTIGEVCFNTGMSGYQEILTDPSYCKQIVTMTSPHIGNYGVNGEDIESKHIQVSGFVIKEETLIPSNWRSVQSIGNYLNEHMSLQLNGTLLGHFYMLHYKFYILQSLNQI